MKENLEGWGHRLEEEDVEGLKRFRWTLGGRWVGQLNASKHLLLRVDDPAKDCGFWQGRSGNKKQTIFAGKTGLRSDSDSVAKWYQGLALLARTRAIALKGADVA